jgi:hypothetical protein
VVGRALSAVAVAAFLQEVVALAVAVVPAAFLRLVLQELPIRALVVETPLVLLALMPAVAVVVLLRLE